MIQYILKVHGLEISWVIPSNSWLRSYAFLVDIQSSSMRNRKQEYLPPVRADRCQVHYPVVIDFNRNFNGLNYLNGL